ncbi:MAG: YggS family pyridoxal phosphate-dependent enzyme [Planctomycetes bacterium]|nr:YggS family pyridoxal phosphate-dependent enzyme [Planctomycetota bacterium]
MKVTLRKNRERLTERIAEASSAADRSPSELCVVAITKYVEPEAALALAELGQRDLGENRAASLEAKAAAFRAAEAQARWHFVGHLQRNKARRVAKIADVIHSVDTPQLIRTLDRIAMEEERKLELFLEVRLTDEPTKHGFSEEELSQGLDALRESPHLVALGLMGMSPARGSSATAGDAFSRLRALADSLEADPATRALFHSERVLTSMGMSGDFPQAIAAGADYLRIGSSFFEGLDQEPKEVPA